MLARLANPQELVLQLAIAKSIIMRKVNLFVANASFLAKLVHLLLLV